MLNGLVQGRGLANPELVKVVKLFTRPNTLRQSQVVSIIKRFLLPRDRVSDEIVLCITSSLASSNETSIAIKERLLRWLVVISKYLANPKILATLYDVLLMNLKYETYRPWLCHLLVGATNSHNVKPWRIQYLLELYKKDKNNMFLVGLLNLYKEYAPQLIVDRFKSVRGQVFKHPDEALDETIGLIQQKRGARISSSNGLKLAHKRLKLEIPSVQTSLMTTQAGIEDITSLDQFVGKVDKLQLPLQISSVLQDSGFAVRLLIYKGDDKSWDRLNSWLCSVLFELIDKPSEADSLLYLLKRVDRFVSYTKIFPIAVEEFFLHFLPKWDGDEKTRSTVFSLISHMPLTSAQLLTDRILEPLARIMMVQDLDYKARLVEALGRLLKNWDISYGQSILAHEPVEGLDSAEVENTFQIVLEFINEFGLDMLEESYDNILVQLSLLDFSRSLCFLSIMKIMPLMLSDRIFSRLAFTASPVILSQLSQVLADYRPVWMRSPKNYDDYRTNYLQLVNSFANLIWNDQAFYGKSPFGLRISYLQALSEISERNEQKLASVFGLSSNSVVVLSTLRFVKQLEQHDYKVENYHRGPVSPESLERIKKQGGISISYEDFKSGLLRFMDEEGYRGFKALIDSL